MDHIKDAIELLSLHKKKEIATKKALTKLRISTNIYFKQEIGYNKQRALDKVIENINMLKVLIRL